MLALDEGSTLGGLMGVMERRLDSGILKNSSLRQAYGGIQCNEGSEGLPERLTRKVVFRTRSQPQAPSEFALNKPQTNLQVISVRPDVGESERAWRRVGGRQIASSEEVFIGGFGDMDISSIQTAVETFNDMQFRIYEVLVSLKEISATQFHSRHNYNKYIYSYTKDKVPTIKAALVPMNRRPRRNAAPQSLNERKGRVVHDRINAPWIRAANKLAPQIRSNNQGTNPSQPFLNIAVLKTEQDIVVTDDIVVAERQKGRRPTRPRNNLKCGVEYHRPRLPSSEERAAQVQRR
ncbi:hypothetical protein BDZ89DRAFT_1041718 [Hymenopellis radicata]|nr:hypothetical protein BDZ89DRAFT_1041718 [Hymenopellis radicata]